MPPRDQPNKFGGRSLKCLSECHPSLVGLAYAMLADSPYDIGIHCGARTEAEQIENIEKGVSWTMDSKHLRRDPLGYKGPPVSHAFDYHIIKDGSAVWDVESYLWMADNIIQPQAYALGIHVRLGVYWKTPDGPHVELSFN